jgi:hypothetical protein
VLGARQASSASVPANHSTATATRPSGRHSTRRPASAWRTVASPIGAPAATIAPSATTEATTIVRKAMPRAACRWAAPVKSSYSVSFW